MIKRLSFMLMFSLFALSFCLLSPQMTNTAHAKTAVQCQKGNFLLLPAWYKHLTFDDNCGVIFTEQVVDASGNVSQNFDYSALWKIALTIVEMLLMLAGMIAAVYTMVGAFQFVTTQGSPDKLAKARTTVTNAIVGAIIAVVASKVVGYITSRFASPDSASYGLVKAAADKGTITTIFNIALTALGAVSVLVLTISGLQFILSSSNPDKVAKARNAIYYSLAGLAVAIFGAAIVNFVIGRLS